MANAAKQDLELLIDCVTGPLSTFVGALHNDNRNFTESQIKYWTERTNVVFELIQQIKETHNLQ